MQKVSGDSDHGQRPPAQAARRADGIVGPDDVLDDRYRLERRLGSGGMATIYQGTDLTLERTVAIKVLHAHLADDQAVLQRFRTEARHAAALLHPHIVNVYDQGFDGLPYIVMEHIDGPSLREVLHARGRLRPAEALAVIGPVGRALARAHGAGVVHRDIKPENVLVTREGITKVVDFGIARALTGTHHTQTGTLVGSVHYLAPELVAGREASPASDQYALGVLLFELLTGRKALPAETPMAVALRHGREPIPAPSGFISDSSDELDAVVARATDPDPGNRFPDVEAFLAALEAAVPGGAEPVVSHADDEDHTLVVPVSPPLASVRTGEHELPASGTSRRVPSQPDERPRRRMGRALLGLLLLLAVTAGGAYAWWAFVIEPVRAVPEVVALPEDEARTLLSAQGLTPEVVERPHDREAPEGTVMSTDPGPGAEVRAGDTVELVVSGGPAFVEMPRVVGLTEADARALLEGEPYFFEVPEADASHSDDVAAGIVMASAPNEGEELRQDARVLIHVSLGIEQVTVPNLAGMSREQAEAALADAQLQGVFREEFSDEEPTVGMVLAQSEEPGAEIDKGSAVEVVVSAGPVTITVPNVVGRSVEAASAELRGVGLEVRVIEESRGRIDRLRGAPTGRVEAQSPPGGEELRRGERVDLYTYTDD